jgi:hypothetical protein
MMNEILGKEVKVVLYQMHIKRGKKLYRIVRFLMYFSGIVGIWIGITGIDLIMKGKWGFGILDLSLMGCTIWNARVNSKQSKEMKASLYEVEQELEKLNSVA